MAYRHPRSAICLAGILLLRALPSDAQSPSAAEPREWLVQAEINRQRQADAILVLQRPDGELLMGADDWTRLRLKIPATPAVTRLDIRYYPLRAVDGLSFRLDESRLLLILEAPPHALLPTVIAKTQNPTPQAKADPGLFLNYDAFAQYNDGQSQLSGLLETGIFSDWGAGVSDFVGRDITGQGEWVRLNSTLSRDFPEQLTGLRLGDSISRPGAWGGAARFGGLQYGTRFAVQPELITQPLGQLSGEAALPSTVDVYLNGMRTSSQDIAPGPFFISDLPLVTGPGELRMVVRDVLGREQIVTETFYRSPSLLRQGLNDYSLELGWLRHHFGTASADYRDGLAAGTFRRGLTDGFTGEAHAEWAVDHTANVGMGGDFLLGSYGAATIAAALGHGEQGEGGLLQAGLQVQPSHSLSLGGRWQGSNGKLFRVGSEQAAPRQQWAANLSYTITSYATLGASYLRQENADRYTTEAVSGSLNLSLGRWAFINVTAQAFFNGQTDYMLGTVLTVPLGERSIAATHADWRWGSSESSGVTALYSQSAPYGEGIGYRLETGSTDRHAASFASHTRYGSYQLDGAAANGRLGARASASGGLGFLGGEAFAMRRIEQSFALVHLPELPNVRVYTDNQLIGRTDDNGALLIPRLRPYQRNPVSIEQQDLPFDAQIDALKVEVTPYFRSGVIVEFPVRRVRGGTLKVMLENGSPLPAGATVRLAGSLETFPVAEHGEVYLTGLGAENRLQANWKGQVCELTVSYPQTDDPLPDLKTVLCRGVKP